MLSDLVLVKSVDELTAIAKEQLDKILELANNHNYCLLGDHLVTFYHPEDHRIVVKYDNDLAFDLYKCKISGWNVVISNRILTQRILT